MKNLDQILSQLLDQFLTQKPQILDQFLTLQHIYVCCKVKKWSKIWGF